MLMTKDEEVKMINSYRLTKIDDYVNKRSEEFVNCKNLEVINYEHYKQLLYDLRASLRSYPDMKFINNYIKETRKEIHKPLFSCYGMGGFTKEIKISPEEAEKLKSELIEWDGEFYPKSAFESKIEYNEDMLEQEAINKFLNMIAYDYGGELAKIFKEKYINKDKEIERLNDIVNELIVEKEKLLKYKRFIYNIVITPVDWKNSCHYELHNYTKQELYNELYNLRKEIIEELRGDK